MTTFGLYAAIGDPPHGERLQQCIDEVCAEAQLAEQVGFEAFGVPLSQRVSRLEEGIEIIRGCWTQERFSYNGRRFQLRDLAVYPKPVQHPHPPIWVGAMADDSIRRAAHYGDAWLTGMTQPLQNILRHTQIYQAYVDELQRPAHVILMRDAWVAETRQRAEEEYGPEVIAAYKYYWQSHSVSFRENRSEAELTLENMASDRLILGSPEEVVGQLQRWIDSTHAEMVIFRLRQAHSGGPPHDNILRAIRLFGDRVPPKLA